MEQFIQTLAAAGIPQETIDALKDLTPEQLKEFKPDEYVGQLDSAYRTKLLNDSSFLESITEEKIPKAIVTGVEKKQYGRFMSEFRREAEAMGVDLKDLTEEQTRSLSLLAKATFDRYGKKIGSPEGLAQVQSQLREALQKNETFETELTTKVEAARKEESGKASLQLTRLVAIQKVASIPGLAVDPSDVATALHEGVAAKYSVSLNPDTLQFELGQKGNPALKALKGSKEITYEDALLEVAQAKKGFIVKADEKKDEEVKKVKVEVDGGNTYTLPDYIAKQAGVK